MVRTASFALVLAVAGCFPVKQDVKPITLSGTDISGVVQSKYVGLDAIPEFYTNTAEVRIDITVAGVRPAVKQTVLWYRKQDEYAWQRGPATAIDDRWIRFSPAEGRYACRASVVYDDGTEDFLPYEDSTPCFCLVVDRTPPHLSLSVPSQILANTTTAIRFEIWDSNLAASALAELHFSSDGAKTWERLGIIEVSAGESSHGWEVPERPGQNNFLRLICRDLAGNQTDVQTREPFTILPHPSTSGALERLFKGTPQPDDQQAKPAPPRERDTTPKEAEAKGEALREGPPEPRSTAPAAPPSSRQAEPSVSPARLALDAPAGARAGEPATIRVAGVPADGTPRLLWRSSAADPWEGTNAVWKGDHFAWTFPQRETFQGGLKVEVMDRGGRPLAAAEVNAIVVDGRPPDVGVHTSPSTDASVFRVQAVSRDTGTGTAWIKLFVTRDDGQTWEEFSESAKPEVELSIRREQAALGLFAQSQDRVGNTSPAPQPGTKPGGIIPAASTVEIALNDLGRTVLRGGERLHLTWQVTGACPPGGTARVAVRKGEEVAWEPLDAVDLAKGRHLWEVPAHTIAALWLRVELHYPGGATLAGKAAGPYAVDSDPPSIAPEGAEFWASSLVRLPLLEAPTGPATIASVTMYLRRQGENRWQPLATTYEQRSLSAPCLNLAEGVYDVFLRARDAVGNAAPEPAAATAGQAKLTVDKTPPRIDLKLGDAYDEGVPGAIDLVLAEPCAVVLLFRKDGERAELSLASLTLPAGPSTHTFRPPPGVRKGQLWARARDRAGNREETAPKAVEVRAAARFIAPHGGESFAAGDTLTIEYWIHEELLREKPEAKLWWSASAEGAREPIAHIPSPAGTFLWTVPDRPGAGNTMSIEVRATGVLRSYAELGGTFEIKKKERAPAVTPPAPARIADVDPLSIERAREGHELLAELAKAIDQRELAKVKELREQAETRFRAALGIDPRNADASWGLSRLYVEPYAEKENLAKAEEYLAAAVGVNPTLYLAWVNLGIVRLKLKKHLEAESAFSRALDIREDANVRFDLGLALMRQEKFAPAIEHFRRAIDGNGPVAKAYECTIECWAKQENYLKAKEVLAEAVARRTIAAERAKQLEAYFQTKLAARG